MKRFNLGSTSLRIKLTLLLFVINTLSLFFISSLHISSFHKFLHSSANEHIKHSLFTLSHELKQGLNEDNPNKLKSALDVYLWEGYIDYVAVYNSSGQLVMQNYVSPEIWPNYLIDGESSGYTKFEKVIYKHSNQAHLEENNTDNAAYAHAAEGIPNSKKPLPNKPLGTVVTLLNKKDLNQAVATQELTGLLVTFACSILLTSLMYVIAGYWTSRVDKLIYATKQLSEGKYSVPLESDSNDEIGILAVAFDEMRENLKEREREIKIFNLQLRERSQALEKAMLHAEAAKKEAVDANKAKSHFLANVSHEIRTPMNAIIGLTEILHKSELTDAQKRHAQIILQSGQNLVSLIDELLDLARIESGSVKLDYAGFNLKDLCNETCKIFSYPAEKKNLELLFNYPEGAPENFLGDCNRLRQVITNLIGNALKFTEAGSISLSIHMDQSHVDYITVYIKIKDTGIGIPRSMQNEIFDKFTQVDDSNARKYGGAGLGLSISKQLILLMGGTIELQSDVSVGSCFTIQLPMHVSLSTEVSVSPKEIQETSPANKGESFYQKHILIVEDNVINQVVAQEMLALFNFEIDIANDGLEAVEAIQKKHYDLIFMDMQMPHCNGLEATEKIRRIEKSLDREKPHTIIAMTANARKEDREDCIAIGMDDFLSKPIRLDSLKKIIEKYL
ncbi:hypothetical protein SCG7109_AL_00080 [Chlamydiales bacterium SCGC AG-110-M15]|nr:hypothetical protein SCG7109_AL_00080 [Chlamydiales bacterium SCGC AG-110-M15]